jgi:hypothetical protein
VLTQQLLGPITESAQDNKNVQKIKNYLPNSNINDSLKCSRKYCCIITTAITTTTATTTATTTIPTNKDIKSLNNFLCGESFIEGKIIRIVQQFNTIKF